MKYRFTLIVANIEVAVGVILVVAGAALAIVATWKPSILFSRLILERDSLEARVLIALIVFAIGVLVGTAFIVGGQLVLAFLEMRSRLVRIDRRLRGRGELSTLTDELRRRRL